MKTLKSILISFMEKIQTTAVERLDLIDTVCLCHAGLAQDSPEPPSFYLNQVMNLLFGYLTSDQRKEVENYLAEKKYLITPTIQIAK